MATVVTSIEAVAGSLKIQWTEPHDGFQDITNYLVEIYDGVSGWHQSSDHCNGSDPTLTECIVPMSVLRNVPYSLTFQDLIEVRATAQNSYGFANSPSKVNTEGALVRTEPDQMQAPAEVYSTDLEIKVEWQQLTGSATGDS